MVDIFLVIFLVGEFVVVAIVAHRDQIEWSPVAPLRPVVVNMMH